MGGIGHSHPFLAPLGLHSRNVKNEIGIFNSTAWFLRAFDQAILTKCVAYPAQKNRVNRESLGKIQGVLQRSVILWKPRMPTKTIHGVRNVICTCSVGKYMAICFLPLE